MSKSTELLSQVFRRIQAVAETDEDMAQEFVVAVDDMLDEMLGQDAFGTEGQCDPRGDQRNGDFDIWSLEE